MSRSSQNYMRSQVEAIRQGKTIKDLSLIYATELSRLATRERIPHEVQAQPQVNKYSVVPIVVPVV